jgi:hypothetical protein
MSEAPAGLPKSTISPSLVGDDLEAHEAAGVGTGRCAVAHDNGFRIIDRNDPYRLEAGET